MFSMKITCVFFMLALPLRAVTFNILEYGAVGDGNTLNTVAIQKAVDTAAAAGGGTVLVPAGKFLTGPFILASGINLELARDAIILISDDRDSYPVRNRRYVDAITAENAHDIKITGSGTIDGQGESWWNAFRANPKMTHRPYLIKFTNCQRVEVAGVTLENSPMFHLAPQNCTDVSIHDITIHSPADAPNTDGIDPSGWNFYITRCHIDTGDDNIAIKPSRQHAPGNKNFLITDCQFVHGHGMSIGGGSAGGLDGLTVSNCAFADTDAGIRIKTPRGNGGLVQHAVYEDLTMNEVKRPIYIIDWYPERNAPADPATEKPEPLTPTTPLIQHIVIRNVTATNCPTAGIIRGLPEAPITDVLLTNIHISAQSGLLLYYATDVKFVDSSIHADEGKDVTTFSARMQGLGVSGNIQ
jgi:polygalacturonase